MQATDAQEQKLTAPAPKPAQIQESETQTQSYRGNPWPAFSKEGAERLRKSIKPSPFIGAAP